MRINSKTIGRVSLLVVLIGGLFGLCAAQDASPSPERRRQVSPTVIEPNAVQPMRVTHRTNMLCAGFIQYAPRPNYLEIVGGEQEQEHHVYTQGAYLFINRGADEGIKVGNEFTVVRPRGQFDSKFSNKRGWLGVYTQEVGAVEVVEVKAKVSVAIVTAACDTILLGDLLRPLAVHDAPLARTEELPDRFADPSGKAIGRIVLSRDSRELLSRDQIVFIDLGAEDNVTIGDYLTVFRPIGKGNITHYRDDNVVQAASGGYGSAEFDSGPFSNSSQRVKDGNGNGVYGPTRTTPAIKRDRPQPPRKYVGEVVVLNVQARTATVVITRVAGEVHTGDYVELQ